MFDGVLGVRYSWLTIASPFRRLGVHFSWPLRFDRRKTNAKGIDCVGFVNGIFLALTRRDQRSENPLLERVLGDEH
jgi:hypothetical protein